MERSRTIFDLAALIANVLTIVASAIAIYIFFAKRKEISNALSLLVNWSFQTTLSDLKGKLDRLNEYSANEPTELPEIANIFHEIAGQIRGNRRLRSIAPKLAGRIESLARIGKLTEPSKRSMIAEIREFIRNTQVTSFDLGPGDTDE